jgi:hypothetical protein
MAKEQDGRRHRTERYRSQCFTAPAQYNPAGRGGESQSQAQQKIHEPEMEDAVIRERA